jgi:hypothetical protein
LHVLAALAAAGLEQREHAIAQLRRAIALDPDLGLTPEDQSPRVLELLQEARSQHPGPSRP